MSVHPNFKTGLPCYCGFGKHMEGHTFTASAAAPWEPGQWGKGLYFPETDHLVTWGDERQHYDVWSDDEYGSQSGPAHHLLIRPNGSVRDQGAFDRDFRDVEGDFEGLHHRLKEYDPRLKLENPSTWDFNVGPTEPVPDSPEWENKDGHHTPQISNDYIGPGT